MLVFSFQERTRYHFLLRNCVLWTRFRHPEGRKNKTALFIASQREWSNTLLSIVLSWDRMTAIEMNCPRTDKIMDDWTFLLWNILDSISEISSFGEWVASQCRRAQNTKTMEEDLNLNSCLLSVPLYSHNAKCQGIRIDVCLLFRDSFNTLPPVIFSNYWVSVEYILITFHISPILSLPPFSWHYALPRLQNTTNMTTRRVQKVTWNTRSWKYTCWDQSLCSIWESKASIRNEASQSPACFFEKPAERIE